MKLKKIAYILCGLLLVSCNDSFLESMHNANLSDKHTLLPKRFGTLC